MSIKVSVLCGSCQPLSLAPSDTVGSCRQKVQEALKPGQQRLYTQLSINSKVIEEPDDAPLRKVPIADGVHVTATFLDTKPWSKEEMKTDYVNVLSSAELHKISSCMADHIIQRLREKAQTGEVEWVADVLGSTVHTFLQAADLPKWNEADTWQFLPRHNQAAFAKVAKEALLFCRSYPQHFNYMSECCFVNNAEGKWPIVFWKGNGWTTLPFEMLDEVKKQCMEFLVVGAELVSLDKLSIEDYAKFLEVTLLPGAICNPGAIREFRRIPKNLSDDIVLLHEMQTSKTFLQFLDQTLGDSTWASVLKQIVKLPDDLFAKVAGVFVDVPENIRTEYITRIVKLPEPLFIHVVTPGLLEALPEGSLTDPLTRMLDLSDEVVAEVLAPALLQRLSGKIRWDVLSRIFIMKEKGVIQKTVTLQLVESLSPDELARLWVSRICMNLPEAVAAKLLQFQGEGKVDGVKRLDGY